MPATVRYRAEIEIVVVLSSENGTWSDPMQVSSLTGTRILIVEDETLVAMPVEDELLNAGAHVVGTATSVAEALRMIEVAIGNGGISAAVLDINLDGELVWLVTNTLDEFGVPFVFETGYASGCDVGKYVMAPILHKPFDPQALIGTVAGLVTSSLSGPVHVPTV